MIAKETLTIPNHSTASPKADPRVFVTAHECWWWNSDAILIVGVTGIDNVKGRLKIGALLSLGGYEFRLLSVFRDDEAEWHANVSVMPANYDAFEPIFRFRATDESDSSQFTEDEIADLDTRLLQIEKNLREKAATNAQESNQIRDEFERLRKLLRSQTRGIWYDILVGVLAKLAVSLGLELVEPCGASFVVISQKLIS
ncbi:MAG: hypothetical protein IIA66_11525 [Planctomycetes bacterium]|nr:hypothetical protein [Planctomycetota bacterium]